MTNSNDYPPVIHGFACAHSYEKGPGRHTFTIVEGPFIRVGESTMYSEDSMSQDCMFFRRTEISKTREGACSALVSLEMGKTQSILADLRRRRLCLRGFLRSEGVEDLREFLDSRTPPPKAYIKVPRLPSEEPSGLLAYPE